MGDQILTINNNLSAVQSIGSSSADIIDEPTTDEVLLRLVQRLASIKKSQKDSTNDSVDQQSEKILSIEEDENQNYKSQWTNNIEKCDENHRAVQRQTTLLSHELLREETRKDDSDDETSDSSNEFISYTIESINGYDDSQQSKQSGSTLNLVINDNNNNNNNNYNNVDNENNSYERDDEFEEFVITNDQDDTQEEEEEFLLVDYNMGSNVSRNSGKGLTGRRTQSSGNLYSDKRQQQGGVPTENGSNSNGIVANKANTLLPGQGTNLGNYDTTTGNQSTGINGQNVSETCPRKLIMSPPLCAAQTNIAVSRIDRNKFCGSLPNHLDDSDDVEKDTSVPDNYNIVENSNTTDRIEYVTVVPRARGPQHQQQQFQQHYLGQQTTQQQQHSPYNNSLSEKETASTSSGSSTFKINQDRPDIQLKLPLNRSNFDPSCDQGYGSERSPEDEFPPSMPNMTNLSYQAVSNPLELLDYNRCNVYTYDFITKDCTFAVKITKGPRGLGLSISGGIDSNAPFPGLIRIKRLFPHQAAWSTGQLEPGDIILEVNGIALTGLTNYEALEVLRTMPNEVILLICRPDDEQYKKLSPPSEPPKPPERTQHQASTQTIEDELYPLQPLTPLQTNFTGEFEIIMVKQQGSLGFTLRKEDESVLGHYVRALVREPATTDGRIKPGDKIVAVNDVPLSAMTHEQAVIFLRQAADTVKLRLYRDGAQTPVAAMSPTNSENKTICGTAKKASLRPEAINLLSDLAYKKQTTGTPSANSTESSIKSTNSSPRRLKRGGNKTNNSEVNSQSEQDTTDSKSSSNPQYIVSSQTTSVCSDSEQSVISQCSFIVQPADCVDNGLFKMPSPVDDDRPDRPSFLDLPGQIGSTPMVPRKPCFQFSVAANAYELNNLDNEALDAPIYTGANNGTTNSGDDENQDRVVVGDTTIGLSSTSTLTGNQQLPGRNDFTSLPCETFLIACKTESDLKNDATDFSHRNPLHQSFHVQQNTDGSDNGTEESVTKKDGNKSLLKWKGVVFSPEDDEVEKDTPEAESSCAATAGTNPTPGTERDFDLKDFSSDSNGHKVITVELNRGWNSRLGFSLQPHPETGRAVISAIYSDSVAARDGRLRVGDHLLMVNDESVENTSTPELIDLMRIIRGSIVIKVLRKVDPH